MNMKTTFTILSLMLAGSAYSQPLQIDALSANGRLTFTDIANQGETYSIHWSADLTSNSWRTNWESLVAVPIGPNQQTAVAVPMFYRVVKETVDLADYHYPFGPAALTWLTALGNNPTLEETRITLTNVPVYAIYTDVPHTNFLGYANQHYFRHVRINEVWHEYFGMDSNHIYFFGMDEDGAGFRADPGFQLPRRVSIGKEYSASSPLVAQGAVAGSVSWSLKVVRRTQSLVIGGAFDDVIELEETLTDADSVSQRRAFYARGVGCIKRIELSGGDKHRELFRIDPP